MLWWLMNISECVSEGLSRRKFELMDRVKESDQANVSG